MHMFYNALVSFAERWVIYMIKTIIFDVDNTLYSFDQAHMEATRRLKIYAEKELGIEGEFFTQIYYETMYETIERMGEVAATHNRGIRIQNVLEKLGKPLFPHVLEMESLYWNTLFQEMVVFDGVIETLRILKERNIRIGIGTNMTTRIQLKKLTLLDVLKYVDFFISSEEAGVDKPEEQFFEYCMIKAKCEKQECMFVGDDFEKDIIGSRNAGLRPVWFCTEGNQNVNFIPVIKEMKQLLKLIEL